ncbi:MAG TPA: hypothetical protein VHI54_10150 [Actinomycetota bacterium]|nr:hypothetical protein [Actinomycetota bacterium]
MRRKARPDCMYAFPSGSIPWLMESAYDVGQEYVADEQLLEFVVLIVGENLMEQVNAEDMGLPPCVPGSVTEIRS